MFGSAAAVPRKLRRAYDAFVGRPEQLLLLSTLALLVGYFLATGITPGIVGQGGYWEYAAGGVAIFIVERLTYAYYRVPPSKRSPTLKFANSFRVGFVFGCVIDACRMSG